MNDLRYPIGKFTAVPSVSADNRKAMIRQIAEALAALRAAVDGLTDQQFETPYRPGGWTVRQVVHHVADSHMNAYCRFKFALTEDNPTIKPYDEAAWANVADTAGTPPAVSIALLEALHQRWIVLLESMSERDFARPLHHPDHGQIALDWIYSLRLACHHAAHLPVAAGSW